MRIAKGWPSFAVRKTILRRSPASRPTEAVNAVAAYPHLCRQDYSLATALRERLRHRSLNGAFFPHRIEDTTCKRTRRVLRYVKMQKDDKEPLAEFIKRKGGINECVVRYGRCLRQLAASRRSIGAFQRRAASEQTARVRSDR
jgi:hypothetical protein